MPYNGFQPGAMLNTQAFSNRPESIEVPVYMTRAPNSGAYGDTGGGIPFPIGKRWIYLANAEYVLLSLTYPSGVPTPTWALVTSTGGSVEEIAGDSGTAFPAVGGIITVSGGSTGLTTSASGSTVSLTGTLDVANGGTGISTTTAYTLIASGTSSTGAFQHLASVGTSGQYLVSNGASSLPTFQTATPQLTVTPVAGATQAMTSNNLYIANDASLTTFTLPTSSAVGDIIQILGSALNSGGWKVTYTTGQIIWGPGGHSTATTGNAATGSAAAQAMNIVCVVANTTWVITSNSGTITLT